MHPIGRKSGFHPPCETWGTSTSRMCRAMMARWDRQGSRYGSLLEKSRRSSGWGRPGGCGGFRTIGGGAGSSFPTGTGCSGTLCPRTLQRNLVAASSQLTTIRDRCTACPTGTGFGTSRAESGPSRRQTAWWWASETRRKDARKGRQVDALKLAAPAS